MELPPLRDNAPFRLFVVADIVIPANQREAACRHFVAGGARYVCVWGIACEAWHDEFDDAAHEFMGFDVDDDEHLVMTTSHENENLDDAIHFVKTCAHHPAYELDRTLILHAASIPQRRTMIEAFSAV